MTDSLAKSEIINGHLKWAVVRPSISPDPKYTAVTHGYVLAVVLTREDAETLAATCGSWEVIELPDYLVVNVEVS
jgi:hypothetical protein